MNVAPYSEHLDLVSLCTGGGGLDLGIGLAIPGARSVVMVEREAFAVAHLVSAMRAGLMAQAPVWSDARTFDGRAWRGCVDGVVGGIPCQPHSMAGRKRGSLDERDLWSTARKIVVQSRAWFVLIENVGGMLSAGADEIAGAERVWRDLRKLGFKVEIGLFSASEVRAPHERLRIFILGIHEGVADAGGERGATGISRPERPSQEGNAGKPFHSGHALEHAALIGRREGRPEPGVRRGRHAAAGDGSAMVDAFGDGRERRRDTRDVECARGGPEGQARERKWGWQTVRDPIAGIGLFPPGPADFDGWRRVLAHSPELEPAVRRMADGMAAGLDDDGRFSARIERLRMLGNGVVPLVAAHAVRTLCARLAARGSARAAGLVRMMEPIE